MTAVGKNINSEYCLFTTFFLVQFYMIAKILETLVKKIEPFCRKKPAYPCKNKAV